MSLESRGKSPAGPGRRNGAPAELPGHGDAAAHSLAVVGLECRLPGADGLDAYERLLFSGGSGVSELAVERLQPDLYFDARKGQPGKTYTTLAGMTSTRPVDLSLLGLSSEEARDYDEVHLRFVEAAARAWRAAGLAPGDRLAERTGVYVGHSGATQLGGWANFTAQIEEALEFLRESPGFAHLPAARQEQVLQDVLRDVRRGRPWRGNGCHPRFEGFSAAALAARVLRLGGPRQIVDAACASSLFALQQARLALEAGRIDAAIVGGATTNGVENLILFSHSQACSERGSSPFDDGAGGLVSSEGYAAILVTRLDLARERKLPVWGVVAGIGVSSDGKGKSLWAPRAEGQTLAMRRAAPGRTALDIDYLEAHATSTQLGDATELGAVDGLLREPGAGRRELLLGSVKSNLGHTLETAGLAGLIKILLSLRREEIPPTIHFRTPNRNFDWAPGRVRVVTECLPWQRRDAGRSAAVSAFGIGGLNAHVIVREPDARLTPEVSASDWREPIAIVGRGVVLPGARNVAEFARLLSSGACHIGPAPEDRWKSLAGVHPQSRPGDWRPPTACGGYIRDYKFDAAAFRVPPKQAQQANPAQWMLLDAVKQAAAELDGGQWSVDRATTGVVIGAIFGGEFGNQLHMGLHLPEVQRELIAALLRQGCDSSRAERISLEFRESYLHSRPALLDETGSFTASTLASRVAKTFDLMGGACAVDADGASGLCGLALALDFLRSGRWSAAVCGAAQRSLDLASFSELHVQGQLVRSGRAAEIPDDLSRFLPGEGAAALLLMRLQDALASGRRILGVIDDVELDNPAAGTGSGTENQDAPLARQIGLLAGAQGMVRLVKETLLGEVSPTASSAARPLRISSQTGDGLRYTIRGHVMAVASIPQPAPFAPRSQGRELNSPPPPAPVVMNNSPPANSPAVALRLWRYSASDHEALRQVILAADGAGAWTFRAGDPVRLTVLAGGQDELRQRLAAIARVLEKGKRRGVLETERAVLWADGDAPPRTVWLFPGQGAQYNGADEWASHPAAQLALSRLDKALADLGLESFERYFAAGADRAAQDVWGNQLWSLGRSQALSAVLSATGSRPDAVIGHSFGEYSALLAAGVLNLPQAVRMVKSRADAVATTVRERGRLISVRGTPAAVDAVLRQHALPVTITHYNAPQQTVIAADADQAARVREVLTRENLASLEVPVPAAYHTSRMAPAEELLRRTFASERFLPPSCACLSPTSLRYLSEPNELRESLLSQMTHPVQWAPAVQRLAADGFTLLVETGPNHILTRLCTEILGDRALCFALDVPGRPPAERLLLWEAVRTTVNPQLLVSPLSSQSQWVAAEPAHAAASGSSVKVVDLRKSHRQPRLVQGNAGEAQPLRGEIRTEPGLANGQSLSATHSTSEAVRRFLTSVVVDLTGYSAEVVDFEADLEADLGIDSIKKAQIVGELAENLGLSVAPGGMKLGDFRTLADIAQLAAHVPVNQTAHAAQPPAPAVALNGHHSASPFESAPAPAALDRASMERFLIDLVVDQTGYSADVVDLDADMEGDLGIDSIKQAQLLGEIQQQFDLSALAPRRGGLTSFTTLRSILDFLERELPEAGSAAFRVRVSEPDLREPTAAEVHGPGNEADPPVRNRLTGIGPAEPLATGILGVDRHNAVPAQWRDLFTTDSNGSADGWQTGLARGQEHRVEIRAALKLLIDQDRGDDWLSGERGPTPLLAGLAAGAGVNVEAVVRAQHVFTRRGAPVLERPRLSRIELQETGVGQIRDLRSRPAPKGEHVTADLKPAPLRESGTMRFVMRLVPAPRRAGTPHTPHFSGPALVLGDNALAREIQARMRQQGLECHLLPPVTSLAEVDAVLEKLWRRELTPHLFITTPHDAEALRTPDAGSWSRRRLAGLRVPYRVCQLWMQRMIEAGRIDQASVAALTSLGGDFGFGGRNVASPEGGIGALLKAMMIEGWMRGVRHTPFKVLDISADTSPRQAIDQLWRELAVPSYDPEIAIRGDQRLVVQPAHMPLAKRAIAEKSRQITPGGTWIVAGGGRGITAVVARELASRHGLKLHLVSASPVPQVDEQLRAAAQRDRSALRRQVIQSAGRDGDNAMEAWRRVEKGIEIDATLRACAAAGVPAVYHSCDLADAAAVRKLVDQIRQTAGPIRGVIQGAGFGQDARFDRKRADKVDQCLAAKIDGTIHLMEATREDPLDWFVGFGSISGRFGANGHTDYSLANDTLAKLIDRYRMDRPEVRSVTFHWHAWGDIGMATKPETRLALEMIQMEFMPAQEGLDHFLGELEHGGDEPEVLITDRRYFRKFFPAERGFSHPARQSLENSPLLDPQESGQLSQTGPFQVTLDPARERFLQQHLVDGKPTLPFVFALELMAQAARRASGQPVVIAAREVRAQQAVKWSSEAPLTLTISTELLESGEVRCRVLADVQRRDGRIVAKDREYFAGVFRTGPEIVSPGSQAIETDQAQWQRMSYPEPGGPMEHGPDLQLLREFSLHGPRALGRISASVNSHLGGEDRPTTGWSIPCAALDACLFACVFADKLYEHPSLPVSFESLKFGRLPDPGEACLVESRLVARDQRGAVLDFDLVGQNGDILVQVSGHRLAFREPG